MLTQIINGKILTPQGWLCDGSIIIKDSKILEVVNSGLPRVGAALVDAKGDYIIPGYVALNVHGAAGHDFKEGTLEAFDAACKAHLKHGATTIFPTVYTVQTGKIEKAIKTCEEYMKQPGSTVKGLHIAGPYFNEKMVKSLAGPRNPKREEYVPVLDSTSCIKRWDISPEIPGALEMAQELRKRGIVAAISHTLGEYEDIKKAYDAGFTHAAQFYNSMPGFHKRGEYKYEGTVESVYLIDGLSVGVIADGKHLPATILKLIYKIKGTEKISLVTNALKYAAYDGEPDMDSDIVIDDGVCKLKDRTTIAGSIATMDTLVKVMVNQAEVPLQDAVRMASETPARLMNCWDRVGSIEVGKDADILTLNKNLDITSIWSQGRIVEL